MEAGDLWDAFLFLQVLKYQTENLLSPARFSRHY
jgi:hypothetical protein